MKLCLSLGKRRTALDIVASLQAAFGQRHATARDKKV
jgi:hypothetical protein